MKTHYEILGIAPDADAQTVRRAFRTEIARYHPDKVQHLGQEFQDLAQERAARLTEAYRVLTDPDARRDYDASLVVGQPASGSTPPQSAPPPVIPKESATEDPLSRPRAAPAAHAATQDLVRRAVLAKVRAAVSSVGGSGAPSAAFDAVFEISGRRGLFRKAEAGVRIAVRTVPQVDSACVEEAWPGAQRLSSPNEQTCLVLLGHSLAPAGELAASVTSLRKKGRGASPIVVPVDVRTWEALVPPNTPRVVRQVLDNLRSSR